VGKQKNKKTETLTENRDSMVKTSCEIDKLLEKHTPAESYGILETSKFHIQISVFNSYTNNKK